MTELPTFDPPVPAESPAPPKKPRPKPQRAKRKPQPLSVTINKGRPKKARRKKHAAKAASAATKDIIAEMKDDFAAFIREVYGFQLEPWQMRLIKYLSEQKS